MSERIIHFFRVPVYWTNKQIQAATASIKAIGEYEFMIANKEVEYTPINIKVGDKLKIIRSGDILEVIEDES